MSKKDSITVSFVMSKKLKDKIAKTAEKEGRTFSNLLRKVLSEKFKI